MLSATAAGAPHKLLRVHLGVDAPLQSPWMALTTVLAERDRIGAMCQKEMAATWTECYPESLSASCARLSYWPLPGALALRCAQRRSASKLKPRRTLRTRA